jgi:hypothetical protein
VGPNSATAVITLNCGGTISVGSPGETPFVGTYTVSTGDCGNNVDFTASAPTSTPVAKAVPVVDVKHEAVVLVYGQSAKRLKLGIAELVDLTIKPDPDSVHWEIEGTGLVYPSTANPTHYAAPERASVAEKLTVTVTYGGKNSVLPSITFEVVEPSGVVFIRNGYALEKDPDWHNLDEPTAGFNGLPLVRPDDVSFQNITVREAGGTCEGYGVYAYMNGVEHKVSESWYNVVDGLEYYFMIENNVVHVCDQVRTGIPPEPWGEGYWVWPIAWEFQTVSTPGAKKFCEVTNFVNCDDLLTVTNEKGGTSATFAIDHTYTGKNCPA